MPRSSRLLWRKRITPARPITLIVPLQAGTASDLVARILSDKVGAKIGQPIVVENAPGAGGATGSLRVARAAPDGYTIGALNNGIHTVLPHIVAKLPFEPFKDFEPVTQLARFPSVLIVNKDLPAQTLKDFIALAKKDPGKLNHASVGPGSPQHLAMEQLKADAGIDMTHVPYRGGAQAHAGDCRRRGECILDRNIRRPPLHRSRNSASARRRRQVANENPSRRTDCR